MPFQLIRKPAAEVEVGERYVRNDGERLFVDDIRVLDGISDGTIVLVTYYGEIHCSPETPITIANYIEPKD